jgi:hypothetical protein
MIRRVNLGLVIALGWTVVPLPASEPGPEKPGAARRVDSPEGNRRAPSATREAPTPAEPDFKVVFWFDGATPRHQVYDVRKGQFTTAVEDWVRRHQQQRIDEFGFVYPGAMAVVRNISLKDEPGRTDQEKLEAGIARVSRALYAGDPADLSRLLRGYARNSQFAPQPQIGGARPSTRLVPEAGRGPLGNRSYLNPSRPYPSPVPYPYSRPHP